MNCRIACVLALCALGAACARPAPRFSLENAQAHVEMLAGTIGSRPVGTPENERARQYIIDQLHLFGFDVRVQETDARSPSEGRSARVANIIAVRNGPDRDAIAVLSHYDSAPDAPGAADDGLGVAVALEAARVLGAKADRRHSLMVLVTDGEEAGLLGAHALVTDRDVMDRLQAYVNVEAVGSSGTAKLFETGPGNAWIVAPWARHAPHPAGASYALEIYRRLPNDTDFSIIKRQDVPGLNFAPIGDSYAYHTARDTPDRLSARTIRRTGENVVETLDALDAMDVRQRSAVSPTYFDAGETIAFSWGPAWSTAIAVAALALGLLGWVRVTIATIRHRGFWRWLLSVVWAIAAVIFIAALLVGITWALREAREVYHPWYAHPNRLFVLLLLAGAAAGWGAMRAGALLPARVHGFRHPAVVWSLTLPLWIALAAFMAWTAPGAAFLWTLPLLVAGALLLAAPPMNALVVRLASIVVLGVAATLWLRTTVELLDFTVAVFGRFPTITPVFVYAALMIACAIMVVPPFVAATLTMRPLVRPSAVTAVLLLGTVVAAGFAYAAPAYTDARPQRRYLRAMVEPGSTSATWEVGSNEPGLDLHPGAPGGWTRVTDAPRGSVSWGRLPHPFVFRTTAPLPAPPPASIASFTLAPAKAGIELSMTILPSAPGLAVAFELPEGLQPARSNLPGIVRRKRWSAVYFGVPADGLTWRASFGAGGERAAAAHAIVTSWRFPGGSGWQQLPGWLPQERAVWDARVSWVLSAPDVIAPVPPLR